jgi:hypothetical protein
VIEGDDTSGGLLDACIAEATDSSYSNDNIDNIKGMGDFSDCCRFSGSCKKTLEEAEECFTECLPTCVKETPREWLDCIADEMDKDSDNCGRQACLDGFLEEDGLQDALGLSGDVLDLKNLEKRLNKMEAEDMEDCGLLEDFVTEVCDIGDNCCKPCREELGLVIDCLINDVVIPFVAIDLNTTIEECPIDTEKCEMDNRRELTQEQLEKFNSFRQQQMALPQSKPKSKRNAKQEAFSKRALEGSSVDDCQGEMVKGILLTNVTEGGNNMMDCVIGHANDAFGQDVTDDSDKESASSVAFTAAGLVAAVAGSIIGFF